MGIGSDCFLVNNDGRFHQLSCQPSKRDGEKRERENEHKGKRITCNNKTFLWLLISSYEMSKACKDKHPLDHSLAVLTLMFIKGKVIYICRFEFIHLFYT